MKFNSRGFYKTLSSYLNINKIEQKLGTRFMKTRTSFPAPSNLLDTPREEKGVLPALNNNEQRPQYLGLYVAPYPEEHCFEFCQALLPSV